MSNNLVYHRAEPQQKKNSYGEFDTLDFNIDVGEGRVLVKNSVRFVAELGILDNGTRTTANIYFDERAGSHAFIDNCQVQFDGMQKESINNYARQVVMAYCATQQPEDAFNASNVCELRGNTTETSILFAKGRITRNTGDKLPSATGGDVSFSMKPMCCLNKMSGGDLPRSKSGVIKLSLNLAPNRSALMGSALNNAQDSYTISSPRVLYQSLPDDGKQPQTIMRVLQNTKNSIQSNLANVQVRVPMLADAVSISLQRADHEQRAPHSNYDLEKPRNINRVEYQFNNATNEYISYPITDIREMQQRFLDSYMDTGHNSVSGDRFNSDRNFGLGLSFDGLVDLTNQNFGIQISSSANNQHPYNLYAYFHGIVAV